MIFNEFESIDHTLTIFSSDMSVSEIPALSLVANLSKNLLALMLLFEISSLNLACQTSTFKVFIITLVSKPRQTMSYQYVYLVRVILCVEVQIGKSIGIQR